jgi:hypothetical protein
MFLIKTYLAHSSIHGLGVFASDNIRAGQPVWRVDPMVDKAFSRREFMSCPESVRAWLSPYVYVTPDDHLVLCGDNARFMNHSFDANTKEIALEDMIATRDIASGEEVTCDYREMQLEGPLPGFMLSAVA